MFISRVAALFLTLMIVACFFVAPVSVLAQDENEEEPEDKLTEVVVSAERSPEDLSKTARAVSVVTGDEILGRMSRTVPEALRYEEGVMIQRTNLGGGAPFIRGLAGNQVLYLVDGIRLNNSTFRGGPNQYLNTADPFFIDRVEVVRGPSSVLYGSDALGGTINVVTKRRKNFEQSIGAEGRFMGRFSTADGEQTAHFDTNFNAGKRVGAAMSVNYRQFGDIDPGGSLGVQEPYGYREQNFAGNLDFHVSDKLTWQLSAHHVNLDDVPNYDPGNPKNVYNAQTRDLYYTRFLYEDLSQYLDRIILTGSVQQQIEGRERITANNPQFETVDEDEVQTYSLGLQFESPLGRWVRFIYGGEFYKDELSTRRDIESVSTDFSIEADPQLPDGSTYQSAAGYMEARFTPAAWLKLVPGVRFSSFTPDIEMEDPELGVVTVDDPIDDVTWAVHSLLSFGKNQALIMGVSRGFRAPNLSDLAKLGSEDGRFDVPNSELDPETLIQYEAGYRVTHPRAYLSMFGYYSQVEDLVVRKPATYKGEQLINGDVVHSNENAGEAIIYGYEFATKLEAVRDFFFLGGTASYTFGHNESDDEPMRRIPPILGTAWARLNIEPAWIEASSEHAAKQDRLSEADKGDSRIGPNGTSEFSAYHFKLGVTVQDWLEITTGIENAFDRMYKYHGSGPYEAGRNFKTQVSVLF